MVRHSEKSVQTLDSLKAISKTLSKLADRVDAAVVRMETKKLKSLAVTHDASQRSGIDRIGRFVSALEKEVEKAVVPPPPPKPQAPVKVPLWYCIPGQQPVAFNGGPFPAGALVWFSTSTAWEEPPAPPPAPPKSSKK